jgi:hypothetical protein
MSPAESLRGLPGFPAAGGHPEALRRGVHTLALILDNVSTHAPKQLEGWLAALAKESSFALTINVYWLPKNTSD